MCFLKLSLNKYLNALYWFPLRIEAKDEVGIIYKFHKLSSLKFVHSNIKGTTVYEAVNWTVGVEK